MKKFLNKYKGWFTFTTSFLTFFFIHAGKIITTISSWFSGVQSQYVEALVLSLLGAGLVTLVYFLINRSLQEQIRQERIEQEERWERFINVWVKVSSFSMGQHPLPTPELKQEIRDIHQEIESSLKILKRNKT